MFEPEATASAAALPAHNHHDGLREQLQQHRGADTLPAHHAAVDADAQVVEQLIMFMYAHHHLAPLLHTLSPPARSSPLSSLTISHSLCQR
jgi:hypothetical protein